MDVAIENGRINNEAVKNIFKDKVKAGEYSLKKPKKNKLH